MTSPHQIIHIQPGAPRKPPVGAVCNGCGVCCLVAPCPLGVLLSGRRTGACEALRWVENSTGAGVYRCGAISQPTDVLQQRLPAPLRGMAPPLAWALGRLAQRWVAAGTGCDSTVQISETGDPVSPIVGETIGHD